MVSSKPDFSNIFVSSPIVRSELDTMFIESERMTKSLDTRVVCGERKSTGNNDTHTGNCVPEQTSQSGIPTSRTHVDLLPYAYKGNLYFARKSSLESASGVPGVVVSSFKYLPSETNLLFVVARQESNLKWLRYMSISISLKTYSVQHGCKRTSRVSTTGEPHETNSISRIVRVH